MNIAVFVSGRGSNLKAILTSEELKQLVEVKAVISDKISCPAFQIAENFSIPTYSIGDKAGRINYEELIPLLLDLKIDLIVLAGFLKLIPHELIDLFRNRIINIHPALLPSFGGKGLYGSNVHKAVFESSAKVSGATVHFVDYTYDTGNIIAQKCVDISDVNSSEEIVERVIKIEHELLPYVLKKFALGKVNIVDKRVVVH
ncbi:MAG: phosphoribosylglycinamide formyltransferase [Ignavibacteria bacterium RIFOXYB2_FULL_35_12]|nr:MAG: phosphoribosylglycinamide formyltransferase [Ignavibacteria bacterium GWA2_36_19]OGU53557.1 MAG: phosphoribosylglycinamide formyltransferase [Ignavibacteria bacterium GWC2_35_8]OGU60146.1 MAG: phosphoribosylglycinamide formyltransferase [Ignavibacteria bacterium GWF2_35_20]OGU88495.1 MAG: phosphoribosylglycinamide formyltransferase [Ignavibacteria bacterium RIFOXYC12_FULL_35_11]OGU91304.1 MAG: phosphoribosylglycinamide formyltransferase [Ignavibacteria bacterium RIFOXYA12_FULL_35_25]OG